MGLFSHALGCYLFGPVRGKVTHLRLPISQTKFLTFLPCPDLPHSKPFSAQWMAAPSLLQAETLEVPQCRSLSYLTSNPSGNPIDSALRIHPESDHCSLPTWSAPPGNATVPSPLPLLLPCPCIVCYPQNSQSGPFLCKDSLFTLLQAPWPPCQATSHLRAFALIWLLPLTIIIFPQTPAFPTLTSLLSLHANVTSSKRPILITLFKCTTVSPMLLTCADFSFILSM